MWGRGAAEGGPRPPKCDQYVCKYYEIHVYLLIFTFIYIIVTIFHDLYTKLVSVGCQSLQAAYLLYCNTRELNPHNESMKTHRTACQSSPSSLWRAAWAVREFRV